MHVQREGFLPPRDSVKRKGKREGKRECVYDVWMHKNAPQSQGDFCVSVFYLEKYSKVISSGKEVNQCESDFEKESVKFLWLRYVWWSVCWWKWNEKTGVGNSKRSLQWLYHLNLNHSSDWVWMNDWFMKSRGWCRWVSKHKSWLGLRIIKDSPNHPPSIQSNRTKRL